MHGSGDDLPFDDGRFTAVVCFTMLHHVRHPGRCRTRSSPRPVGCCGPAACFAGSDSIANAGWREFHGDDICTPVDPATFAAGLTAAGFADVESVRVARTSGSSSRARA